MNDPTYMRVPLDDETMAAAIEQAAAAKAPIPLVLGAILRDVLLAMQAQGQLLQVVPAVPPTERKH